MEQYKPQEYAMQNILPSDEKAEVNVLGTLVNHDELFSDIDDIIDSSVFHNKRNQAFFRILKYIIQKKQVVDENAVIACYEKFKDKLNVSLDEIRFAIMEIGANDSPRTFQQDVDRLVDYSIRRKTWETLQKTAAQVTTLTENADTVIGDAMKQLDAIRGSVDIDKGIIDAREALRMVYEQINDNLTGVNKASIKTGFRFSDSKGGIRLGSVVVIGAWTSVGKSSLALNMAVNVATSGIPVAYYSLEMGAVELWSRIIGSNVSISAGKILNYPLKREEVATIDRSMNNLMNIPLYIDDKATTKFSKMLRSVRTMVKKYGIKMFVVDYLQIFSQNSKTANEESNIASMARECKNICRELNIVCLLLSQLRRDKEERHPTIDMLRGSGQIEESADNIILIDRPDAHPEWGVRSFYNNSTETVEGKAELKICKGRNIGLGVYYVGFDANRTQFYELDGYKLGDEIGYDDGYNKTLNNQTASIPEQPNNTDNNNVALPF